MTSRISGWCTTTATGRFTVSVRLLGYVDCLSRVPGDWYARFCGEGVIAISSPYPTTYAMQEVLREGAQLLRRLHEPVQHGVRVHLEHPRGASDAHAPSQTRDDPYDEVNRHTLTVKERAEALEKIAATGDTQQLPPGAAIGMTIGVEIAPAHPAAIGTVRVRAEVR